MKYRKLGKTGFEVSEISLGTWQVGGKWGETFDDNTADTILNTAIDHGVNFIDTADVYGGGQSEQAVGRIVKRRPETLYVATKCGRQIQPHTNEGYQPEVLQKFVEDSLRNMQLETLDLIQLHCPPTEIYDRPEIFELFVKLKEQGKIKNMGVSVEKVEEALKAIEYDNVTTVQIIFNMFRLKPAEEFFARAVEQNVGIIVRVPLASGLLTGKFDKNTSFNKGDHRNFNRQGEAFDKGETFSGVPYDVGVEAAERLKKVFPNTKNLAPFALKWILQFNEVSCIIPGASKTDQVYSNVSASELPDLTPDQMREVKQIYDEMIRPHVHHLW
jgi:aryl-alcohol dehydrogenase-like predicted oxidoreductase